MDLYQQNPEFQLAERICTTLHKNGFQALLAGGCVRDFLLGRTPNDFDVATNATPEQVEVLFAKTIAVGKNFGVMVVVDGDSQVEVATFRKDGAYEDGRRPTSVEFTEAEEDAQRRDFTVNGLFFDLQADQVIDYVGGLEDIQKKQIRAIGNPTQRFHEDHLRLLRAVRFSAQLGFQIDIETWKALQASRSLITTVSGERIQEEITKLLLSSHAEQGLELFYQSGLIESLLENERWIWKPASLVFSRKEKSKEDLWFRFFFWLRLMMLEGASLVFFETLCERWKFSRDLRQKTLKALQWTYEEKPFLNHPLGEILASSFEPEQLRGLLEYEHFFIQDEEQTQWEEFKKRRLALGSQKPAPLVVAADLSNKFQGESLGRALRQCYWAQLEGKASSKEELLKGCT